MEALMTDTTLSPAWLALADALVGVAADELADCALYADYVKTAREHGWRPQDFELSREDVEFLDGGQDHEISAPLRHIRDACWRTHRILVSDVQRRVREILAAAMAAGGES